MDKTWVEDPPSRLPYDLLHQLPDAEEENTDKFFIALIVIFLLGLCYCGSHMWRTQKAYKLRLEKETDANIMRNKEKATKLMEPSVSFQNKEEAEDDKKTNGIVIEVIPTVKIEPTDDKSTTRRGSIRFRDVVDKDISWEPLEEKDEPLENDEEESSEIETDSGGEDKEKKKQVEWKALKVMYEDKGPDTTNPSPTLPTQLYRVEEENSIELTSSA